MEAVEQVEVVLSDHELIIYYVVCYFAQNQTALTIGIYEICSSLGFSPLLSEKDYDIICDDLRCLRRQLCLRITTTNGLEFLKNEIFTPSLVDQIPVEYLKKLSDLKTDNPVRENIMSLFAQYNGEVEYEQLQILSGKLGLSINVIIQCMIKLQEEGRIDITPGQPVDQTGSSYTSPTYRVKISTVG